MSNMYIYLLFGIVLYILFTRVLEKYINIEQENFDPSLVPVSSIVTLAKVAQKLVNGNGTLTNPGNLQIGASTSSPGNLTVTGTNTVSGATTLNTLGVTGATTLNTLGVTGNTTVGGTTTTTGLLTANGGVLTSTLNVGAMTNLTDLKATGNIILSTNSAANGVSIGTDTLPEGAQGLRVKGKSMLMGDIQIGNKAKLYSGADPFTNDGWVRLMKADGSAAYSGSANEGFAANNLYSENDTSVNRNLNIGGIITYTGTSLTAFPVGSYKIRAYGYHIPLYYGWNQMWHDHGFSEKMRTIIKWGGSTDEKFVHYAGIDMRNANDGDNNWTARYYALMPGYKLQFYAPWTPVGPEYTGEQTFGDNAFGGKRVHMIAVRLASENWTLPTNIN